MVEPVETTPALVVEPVETTPALLVEPVETTPALVVEPVETTPALLVEPALALLDGKRCGECDALGGDAEDGQGGDPLHPTADPGLSRRSGHVRPAWVSPSQKRVERDRDEEQ